jgi:hypothetical protein
LLAVGSLPRTNKGRSSTGFPQLVDKHPAIVECPTPGSEKPDPMAGF